MCRRFIEAFVHHLDFQHKVSHMLLLLSKNNL
jgi:hypothetical protein